MSTLLEEMMAEVAMANGGQPADVLKFNSEDECLTHLRRVAALKPGDDIMTKADGEPARRGVFGGSIREGRMAHVFFMDEDSTVSSGAFPWGCLRFPE